ncbi:uncharacterized protein KD926_000301 [Aspergillus affinis]|uniref:uncharacterized protein n=1 Tax=Aspergillus affinis TaxID=1070780 RepID=UPI0022FDF30D|nr:uncharacterized protein KD926_000301 [Aspergillus affinis]KAI9037506.1 hypothetical protein KD926_000301 [Aspergillus affinis]
MLLFPKTLRKLEIARCPHHSNPSRSWKASKLSHALEDQRESLEVLILRVCKELIDPRSIKTALVIHPPDPSIPGYIFGLSRFPKLEKYEGFYPDTSGKFKQKQDAEGK